MYYFVFILFSLFLDVEHSKCIFQEIQWSASLEFVQCFNLFLISIHRNIFYVIIIMNIVWCVACSCRMYCIDKCRLYRNAIFQMEFELGSENLWNFAHILNNKSINKS